MIEVTPYTGALQDLQAFVTEIWSKDYAGKMAFPLWTPQYFDWQFSSSSADPPVLIAASERGRVVAALLGLRLSMHVGGTRRQGLLSSWLSVEPAYRGQGLVNEIKHEQLQQFQADGGDLIMSYRYTGSRFSRAARPTAVQWADRQWSSRRIGFWARALDSRRLTGWTLNPIDRGLTRAGAIVIPEPRVSRASVEIRAYDPADLPQCQSLLRSTLDRFRLGIDWTDEKLDRHLAGGGVGCCLVACRGDEICGLVSFHVLPFSARTVEPVGIIDLIAIDALSARDQRALMNAALMRMQDDGAILALKLRTGDMAARTMMMTGFFPRPTDSYQMIHWLTEPDRNALRGRGRCLWR